MLHPCYSLMRTVLRRLASETLCRSERLSKGMNANTDKSGDCLCGLLNASTIPEIGPYSVQTIEQRHDGHTERVFLTPLMERSL